MIHPFERTLLGAVFIAFIATAGLAISLSTVTGDEPRPQGPVPAREVAVKYVSAPAPTVKTTATAVVGDESRIQDAVVTTPAGLTYVSARTMTVETRAIDDPEDEFCPRGSILAA